MTSFLMDNYPVLIKLTLEHCYLVLIIMILAFIFAFPLSFIIYRFAFLRQIVLTVLNSIYAIPSLALFALLIPITGLGKTTAVIVLVLYAQFILVRNMLSGLLNLDPALLEAATGIGLSPRQRFFKILYPLTRPTIIGSLRIASVSVTGMATIAATVNAGGLGVLLFSGLRTNYPIKILWGTMLSVIIAIIINQVLHYYEKKALKQAKGLLHI